MHPSMLRADREEGVFIVLIAVLILYIFSKVRARI